MRGRELLVDRQITGVIVQQREVRERTTDIDANSEAHLKGPMTEGLSSLCRANLTQESLAVVEDEVVRRKLDNVRAHLQATLR